MVLNNIGLILLNYCHLRFNMSYAIFTSDFFNINVMFQKFIKKT